MVIIVAIRDLIVWLYRELLKILHPIAFMRISD